MEQERRSGALVVFVMIAVLIVPAGLTLTTVEVPGTLDIPSDDPTPLGYTWSLSLFLVPLAVLGWWFWRHPDLSWQRRSFVSTILVLLPLGFVLDLVFGNAFFTFPNHGAVLGIEVPAVGGAIPIEEFVFYLSGFLFVLLFYVWCDEYWVAAYNVEDYPAAVAKLPKLIRFHGGSILVGLLLLILAVIYKKVFSGDPEGFPWYLTYLLSVAIVPSAGFFRTASPFINWRAFSVSFFFILLISLVWEATLAAPYGWWGYNPEMMMGIFIGAWSNLPLEAVCVWLAVSYATVIVFEIVKLWRASGRSLRRALFG
ncbi:MAG: hypothetical protein D6696_13785 [Acidobacteria bacterium]|nr:MAG: hypothetical protein D6696_13785 [Acidobacteriota bacterium]